MGYHNLCLDIAKSKFWTFWGIVSLVRVEGVNGGWGNTNFRPVNVSIDVRDGVQFLVYTISLGQFLDSFPKRDKLYR